MTLFIGAARALAIAGFLALPVAAFAQAPTSTPTPPEPIWACYVPTSGTMYRIKVADTKDDCVGNAVAFSWNTVGPKGDKGDTGETGPAGPQGPAGPGGGGFTLPYSAAASHTGNLFHLTNTGTGGAASFGASGNGATLSAIYNGTANANAFSANSSGPIATINANNNSTGPALRAAVSNTNNAANLVNNGTGNGLFVESAGGSGAFIRAATRGLGIVAGTGNGLDVQTSGNFGVGITVTNPNGNSAIWATSNARFSTADFRATGSLSSSTALYAESQSSNAANFRTLGGDVGTAAVNVSNDGLGWALGAVSKGTSPTLNARNTGGGPAAYFGSTNQFHSIYTENTGNGGALAVRNNADVATFNSTNTGTNGSPAANFNSAGTFATVNARNTHTANGFAVWGESHGTSHTAAFRNHGTGGALSLHSATTTASALNIDHTGGGTGVGALWAKSAAQNTAYFLNTGTGNNIAVTARSQGVWPTAQFEHANNGVALRTFGSLDVNGSATINGNFQVNGTKNAIVPTSSGMTKVYSEESTELWFTDYGEAKLLDGVAQIPIDARFAETIDLTAKYHVFVQANDDATLFVAQRTAQGFEVRVRDGARDASFSYRLVAKRKGYSSERLAPADKY